MKMKPERLAMLFLILATVTTIIAIYGYQMIRMGRAGAIVIETHAPENGNFTPHEVTVPVGEKILLEIRNPETVSHGFVIPSLQVGVQEIKPGHVERLEIDPLKAGTYPFYCSTWCTVNHMKMRGVLRVQ